MPSDRRPTLTGALFGRMLILFAIEAVVISLLAYGGARLQVDAAYDAQMRLGAQVVDALTLEERLKGGSPGQPLLSREDRQALQAFADWPLYRIWRSGRLVEELGPHGLLPDAPPATEGFATVVTKGARWRLYTRLMSGQGLVVQIAQPMSLRQRLVAGMAIRLAVPMLLVLPVIAGLLYGAVLAGLGSLRRGVESLARHAAPNLSDGTGAAPARWPADLDELVDSVNTLLSRLSESLAAERRFIDAAAHQLRTPLAAIRLQAQQLRTETSRQERDALSNDVCVAVDRATTLVEQLLLLARLDAGAMPVEPQAAANDVGLALADLAGVAERKGVLLSLSAAPLTVAAPPGLIRVIAANLIDNAVRHTPAGGVVEVSLSEAKGDVILRVIDTGPGLSEEERAKAFERFRQGAASRGGSGLGLAIVAEAARILGGTASLSARIDGLAGLVAEVRAPRADHRPGVEI
jgi:signal transduction histidine kinase